MTTNSTFIHSLFYWSRVVSDGSYLMGKMYHTPCTGQQFIIRINTRTLPDTKTGDHFIATWFREQGQKTSSIPFGDEARGWFTVPFVRNLDCVQP